MAAFPALAQAVNLGCTLCAFWGVWGLLPPPPLSPGKADGKAGHVTAEPRRSASVGPDHRASLVGREGKYPT